MRPVYENAQTLTAEAAFREMIESAWRATLHKLPIRYTVDYCVVRDGKPVAWIECKCRSNLSDAYPTYMISLAKWISGRSLADTTGLPFVLAVKWLDRAGWLDSATATTTISIGGRFDRADWQDVEPVVLIPVHEFKGLDDGDVSV